MATTPKSNPPAPYSPIPERRNEGVDDDADASPGCSCFGRFCFEGRSRSYLLQERGEEAWVATTLKKVKQFSEVVAGPKWKNFLRKIGKLCRPGKYEKQTAAAAQFQYSPESYALNFMGDRGGEEDGDLLWSFSSRFSQLNDEQRRGGGL